MKGEVWIKLLEAAEGVRDGWAKNLTEPMGNLNAAIDKARAGLDAQRPKDRYFRFTIEASVGRVMVRATDEREAREKLNLKNSPDVRRQEWDPELFDLDTDAVDEIELEEFEQGS